MISKMDNDEARKFLAEKRAVSSKRECAGWVKREELEKLRDMLEDVVNELDLSGDIIEKHGQLGTCPAELVRLVLEEKDKQIAMLKRGFREISPNDNVHFSETD